MLIFINEITKQCSFQSSTKVQYINEYFSLLFLQHVIGEPFLLFFPSMKIFPLSVPQFKCLFTLGIFEFALFMIVFI